MNILVGYTGFVGSNLVKTGRFDRLYNSQNIKEAFGTKPDLLVYCGVKAEKFLANKDPKGDYLHIYDAYTNICNIEPKKIVLISTVDVYKVPVNVDESSEIITDGLHAYGLNRYMLEQLVRKSGIKTHIIRLPALYGVNIKKNFIYDLLNVIPNILFEQKLFELSQKDSIFMDYYYKSENGYYKCKQLNHEEHCLLKQHFENVGFSALNFTDSRGSFQFYNLSYLWDHMQIILEHDIDLINIVTEPVTAEEVYKSVRKSQFINILDKPVPAYDVRSKYVTLFTNNSSYIFNKDFILRDINNFVSKMNTR